MVSCKQQSRKEVPRQGPHVNAADQLPKQEPVTEGSKSEQLVIVEQHNSDIQQAHPENPLQQADTNSFQLAEKETGHFGQQSFDGAKVDVAQPSVFQQNVKPTVGQQAQTGTQDTTKGSYIPFNMLIPILQAHLDRDKDMQLQTVCAKLRRNEVHKDDFLRIIRNIVGDQMLKQAAHKVFLQMQAQAHDENLLDTLAETAALATQEKTGSHAPDAGAVEPVYKVGTVGTAEAAGAESTDVEGPAQPEKKQLPPPSAKEVDVLAVKERACFRGAVPSLAFSDAEDDEDVEIDAADSPVNPMGSVDQRKTGIYLKSHPRERKLLAQAKNSFCFPIIEKDLVEADIKKNWEDGEDLALKALLAFRACKRAAENDLDIERGKSKVHADAARKAFAEKKAIQGLYDAARERNEKLMMENEDLKVALVDQEITLSQGKAAKERCEILEKIIEDNAPKLSELEDLKISHESALKELDELRRMKKDYEKLQGESEEIAVSIREGANAAKEAMSTSLKSFGASPADLDFEEAGATEIFSWLTGHAADLGDAGHTFGGISAVVALRVGLTGAIEALGDQKDRLRVLRNPQYKWPSPEDYEKTPALAKNISNNFLKQFWGSHGDQLAVMEAHRLTLKGSSGAGASAPRATGKRDGERGGREDQV